MTDIDGTVYKTVKIGNQWWMAEDLNVRRFRNGNYIIKFNPIQLAWTTDTAGAYCNNKG